MSTSLSSALTPLFRYLSFMPEIRGDEEAFELVMWSDLSLRLLHYPANHITFSCLLPFRTPDDISTRLLWELLQVNLMNEGNPAIVLAASANSDELVVWSRLPMNIADPQTLIALYENMAFYTHTLGQRLGIISQHITDEAGA